MKTEQACPSLFQSYDNDMMEKLEMNEMNITPQLLADIRTDIELMGFTVEESMCYEHVERLLLTQE